jgi:shikimate dehydrogenase
VNGLKKKKYLCHIKHMDRGQDKQFGLIGFPLKNTFSVDYFAKKFLEKGVHFSYKNYPITEISLFEDLLKTNPRLSGLNVTKPYKKMIIPYLDSLAESAVKCGAVNCIQIKESGKKIGHNTDVIGFQKSLEKFIGLNRNLKAIVFGNGGAAKAVFQVLDSLKIEYLNVIRGERSLNNQINYEDLDPVHYLEHSLLINTTSVGMFPAVDEYLPIDFTQIGSNHYCYDLIYLPEKTTFLKMGETNGASIKNGLEMLHLQADAAFEIWMNSES